MRDVIRDNMNSWMALTDSLEQKLEFINQKSEYSDINLLYLVISVSFTAVTAIFFRTVFREFKRLEKERIKPQVVNCGIVNAGHFVVDEDLWGTEAEPAKEEAIK